MMNISPRQQAAIIMVFEDLTMLWNEAISFRIPDSHVSLFVNMSCVPPVAASFTYGIVSIYKCVNSSLLIQHVSYFAAATCTFYQKILIVRFGINECSSQQRTDDKRKLKTFSYYPNRLSTFSFTLLGNSLAEISLPGLRKG